MKNIYSHFGWIFFSFFLIFSASSAETENKEFIDYQPDGLYVENIKVADLENLFQVYQYNDYIYMPNWIYPPIFLKNLPVDFKNITDTKKRNKLFLQILIPLALKLSDEIAEERLKILEMQMDFSKGQDLTAEQEQYLEDEAKKYDIFSRLQGRRRYELLLKQLATKVDIVPPSLLLANAAIESDWGTSRPATKANSLYKELVWFEEAGLDPLDETEDKSYKYKIFPSLYEAMKSYALKINSNINYDQFRFQRAEIRRHDKPVLGRALAHTMIFGSPLPNYAGLLDYTITFYELTNFDESELGFIDIPQNPEDKNQ